MKRILSAVLLLTGCATFRPTSNRYECHTVGENIRVTIQPGTSIDCPQAEATTSYALELLKRNNIHQPADWTVLYTYVYIGLDENGRGLVGVTHPDDRLIKVRVVYDGYWHSPNVVIHELRHASEVDEGQAYASSIHTGWCNNGWAAVERTFTGVTAFLCGE